MTNESSEITDGWLPDWVARLPDVSGGAKLAYAALAGHGKEDGVAHLRIETLAKGIGTDALQAARFIRELQDAKLITADSAPVKGQGNRYYFIRPEER
jgi:hypothetical protein